MRLGLIVAAVLWASQADSETLIATRTLRAQSILTASDVAVAPETVSGSLTDIADVIGMEARVAIYQGRPIRQADLGPPAIIDRNQIVALNYLAGALVITAEGRALGRGGVGDQIRVMNVASRTTVTGVVTADGSVRVLGNN